jgi:HSP20 family protein
VLFDLNQNSSLEILKTNPILQVYKIFICFYKGEYIMNLVPRDSLFDFDKVIEGFFAPANTNRSLPNSNFSPRVDIKDSGESYSIIADLPGVKKDDVHVTLDDGILSLKASTSSEHTQKEGEKIIRQERYSGKFMRSFNLGDNIQQADIVANFKEGVLTLKIPKVKEAEPEKRKISIN